MGKAVCKGICKTQYKATPSVGNPKNKLLLGKCSSCEVRIKWEGKYCPCCGAQLGRRTVTKSYGMFRN